jgi:hypothetical protein
VEEAMEVMESVSPSLIDSGLKIVKNSVEHRFINHRPSLIISTTHLISIKMPLEAMIHIHLLIEILEHTKTQEEHQELGGGLSVHRHLD